jgi:endonuclease/exonuclease/phosphatase family metal-dependent hydrolase
MFESLKFELFRGLSNFFKELFIQSEGYLFTNTAIEYNIHGGNFSLNLLSYKTLKQYKKFFVDTQIEDEISNLYSIDIDIALNLSINNLRLMTNTFLNILNNSNNDVIKIQKYYIYTLFKKYIIESNTLTTIPPFSSMTFKKVMISNFLYQIKLIFGSVELDIYDLFSYQRFKSIPTITRLLLPLPTNDIHSALKYERDILISDYINILNDMDNKPFDKQNKWMQRMVTFLIELKQNSTYLYNITTQDIVEIKKIIKTLIQKINNSTNLKTVFYYRENDLISHSDIRTIFNNYDIQTPKTIQVFNDIFVNSPINILRPIVNHYFNNIVSNPTLVNSIMDYTSNGYVKINMFMTHRIYNIPFTESNELTHNFNLLKVAYEMHSLQQLTQTMPFYVFRGENNINIYPKGGYNTLSIGDTIILPHHYSTSITKPFNRDIFLKIKINNSFIIPILQKSSVPHENEIVIPFGAKLIVTNIEYITNIYNSKKSLLIELDYNEHIYHLEPQYFNNSSIVNQFIDMYKQYYLHLFFSDSYVNLNNLKIDENTPIALLSNLNMHYLLKSLNEVDISNIYNGINVLNAYSTLPPINSKKAYIGENLEGDFQSFCINENLLLNITDTPDKLKILSFNVHNFVTICDNYIPGKNVDKFLSFFEKMNNSYNIDVICLQEVVPEYINNDIKNGNFLKLVNKMNQLGFIHYTLVNCNHDTSYSDVVQNYYLLANAIFSKNKFEHKRLYGLPGNRAVQVVGIKINNIIVDIINTHLEFNIHKLFNTKILIDSQIELLSHIIDSSSNCILAGDFNHDIRTDPRFKKLTDKFKIYNYSSSSNITGFNSNKHIDFILISKQLSNMFDTENHIIKSAISDHYPMFTIFTKKTGSVLRNGNLRYVINFGEGPTQTININESSNPSYSEQTLPQPLININEQTLPLHPINIKDNPIPSQHEQTLLPWDLYNINLSTNSIYDEQSLSQEPIITPINTLSMTENDDAIDFVINVHSHIENNTNTVNTLKLNNFNDGLTISNIINYLKNTNKYVILNISNYFYNKFNNVFKYKNNTNKFKHKYLKYKIKYNKLK